MEKHTKILINTKNLDTKSRAEKALRVGSHMDIILNSKMFKDLILEMPDSWRVGESGKYKNYPTSEIYKILKAGNEEWHNGGDDFIWELHINDYSRFYSRVVGYITPFKKPIWVNTKFFDTMSDKKVGSNLCHEGGHHLGFRHSGPRLRQSLAYYMNVVYDSCYDALIEGKDVPAPKPKEYRVVCKRVWWKLWLGKTCYRVYDV